MNIINVTIDFTNGINKLTGINLITGDYASTKMVFKFDKEDGTKVFELKNPLGELVYVGEIINNELVLAAVENGHNYSIFSSEGRYIYEVSLYDGDSKLTSVKGELPVAKEQVIIDGEIVEPYLPIFDELIQDINQKIDEIDDKIDNVDSKIETIDSKIEEVNTAIEETNNLNIDVSDKVNKEVTITLTKKDNTTKSVKISDGLSLQFMWQGTSLGIKTDDMQDYVFVDLQGIQGIPGPQGEPFRIKKNYPSVQAMENDFNNMQLGDYVMIASDVEQEDNAKLYTRGEIRWIFITDFSGATGIKGETGATPNIQIGSVTSGNTPSVTRTGTDENPVLNFVLQKGEKGDTGATGPTGPTGNGISNITKTSTSGLVDTYTITYTNGTTQTYEVTNGEDGEVTQSQLDEVIAENDYLNSIIDQIVPKTTATGTSITLDDTLQAKMNMSLSPSELEQETTTGKNLCPVNSLTPTLNTTTTLIDFGEDKTFDSITLSFIFNGSYSQSAINVAWFDFKKDDETHNYISPNTFNLTRDTNYTNIQLSNTQTNITFRYLIVYFMTNNYNKFNANSTMTNIMLSTSGGEYEPYTNGASPNPSYPQEIHTISGDNTIKVCGKNLWHYTSKTEDGWYTDIPNFINKVGTYTLSINNSSLSGNWAVYFVDSSKQRVGDFIKSSSSVLTPSTFSVSQEQANAPYIRILPNASGLHDLDAYKFMVNVGSTALDYEPYQEQTAQVNLGDLEYSKIGNYADEFYRATDSDTSLISGKWYIKKNIGKVVLDGSENWQLEVNTTNYYEYKYFTGYNSPSNISSHFDNSTNSKITISYNYLYLRFPKSAGIDVSSVELFKNWLTSNNVLVDYVLATPTYILLNNNLQSQLDTIESMLLSYKGQTNISQINNDLPFIMTSTALKEL